MSVNKVLIVGILALNILTSAQIPALSASSDALPMNMEEMKAKRQKVREDLMLPSLAGIRSISYRVVGYKNFEPLEKLMGSKLGQLNIPSNPVVKMESLKKTCDAIVQISFSQTGAHTIGELKVTQWVSLLRDPKNVVRAVTYSDKDYILGDKPEQLVEQLSNQFVIDFLKANQKAGKSKDSGGSGKKSTK